MEYGIKIDGSSGPGKVENVKEVSDFVLAVLASPAADEVKVKALGVFSEMAATTISHCHIDGSTHHHYPTREPEMDEPRDYSADPEDMEN